MTQGDSVAEAVEMIQDAMAGWIEIALADGTPVPEPRRMDEYSGKFVVRVPSSLHRDLVRAAEREGVSLNQFAVVALARAVGPAAPPREEQHPVRRSLAHEARLLHVAAEQEPSYGDT
jgi:predicted HicB family RNase H-like nuclease